MTTANLSSLASPAHRLAALVFTDIVGSTQLKSTLRTAYLRLLTRHNELFEIGVCESPGAEIIKHTGDGYFASFPTASDAVRFALMFQARMRLEPWDPVKIETRLGIHIGEVVFVDMAGRKDIVGLSADVAARLMSLAVGGQILLTDTAFNDARQYVNSSPDILAGAPTLRWSAHGRYLFKGTDEPLEVYEVGVEGCSPLERPADSEKVKRVVPHDQESTLGWRPASGLAVPGRPGWQLSRKLGEGGFGEVWLGEHTKLKELRVFKFCFDVQRLRSLRREYMLFRLLREALGRRPDIAALYEVQLEDPPYFLESEYSDGGNLLEWSQSSGGMQTLPMPARLELLAKIADAVAAAHSVGVLHKDIKPSNVLLYRGADGQLLPRLADFGIGALSDRSRLKAHNVTDAGVTEMVSGVTSQSTGTRMYLPPESMVDVAFTTRGDIYALGVMLYQFVVADLLRPLAAGWERDVEDELLRQDIAAIVEGNPDRRVATADEVARRMRSIESRRAELEKTRALAAAQQRRVRRRRIMFTAGGMLVCLLGAVAIGAFVYIRAMHAERARTLAATRFLLNVIASADPANSRTGAPMAEDLIRSGAMGLDQTFTEPSDINADLHLCFASALRNFNDPAAVSCYEKAAEIETKLHGPEDERTLAARYGAGYAMLRLNRNAEAEPLLRDVLEKQRRTLGLEHRDTLNTSLIYAAVVSRLQGPQIAEPMFRSALEARRRNFGDDDRDTIQSIGAYAWIERDLGRLEDAERQAKVAMDWRIKHFGPTHFLTLPSIYLYSVILTDLGRADEAEPLLKTLPDQWVPFGVDKPEIFRADAAYADALSALNRRAEAETFYLKAIEGLRKQKDGDQNEYTMAAESGYAELLTATGRAAIAEPLAREARDTLTKLHGVNRRDTLRATYALACALDASKDPMADQTYRAAIDGATGVFGAENPITRRYAKGYSDFLAKIGRTAP